MTIPQISVFLENKTGQLADITGILSDNQVNMRAINRLAHLAMGTPAGTCPPCKYADVSGTVAEQRKSLLGNGGEYQLALT